MKNNLSQRNLNSSKIGFALAEVVVALFFVTLTVFIIGSLSQQVINFKKSTSQTGALIELKTLTSTVARNPDKWLGQMKSVPEVASIYSGCLSEISTATGYACPTPSAANAIINGDTRLQEYATGMFVIDTPMVDSLGRKIAGTQATPHYMHSDGRACLEINKTNCALQSVGYFMRSNSANDQDPGQVRFVMKVERTENVNTAKVGNFPMKPQYMSIELGEDWKESSTAKNCPANTIQVGYLSDGKRQCINPTASCTGTNEVQIGINADGTPKCQAPATPCTGPDSFVVYDPNSGGLTCAATSPCATGTFTGYYSGTGDPMCESNPPGCTSTPEQKKVQMGRDTNGEPICANVDPCTSNLTALAFNGTNFICQGQTSSSSSSAEPNTERPPSDMIVCSKRVPYTEWDRSRWTMHCGNAKNILGQNYPVMCMPGGQYSTSFSTADCGGRTVTPQHIGIVAEINFCNGTDTFGVLQAGATQAKWSVINVNVPGSVVSSPQIVTGPGLFWYKSGVNGAGTCQHEDNNVGSIRVVYFKP